MAEIKPVEPDVANTTEGNKRALRDKTTRIVVLIRETFTPLVINVSFSLP